MRRAIPASFGTLSLSPAPQSAPAPAAPKFPAQLHVPLASFSNLPDASNTSAYPRSRIASGESDSSRRRQPLHSLPVQQNTLRIAAASAATPALQFLRMPARIDAEIVMPHRCRNHFPPPAHLLQQSPFRRAPADTSDRPASAAAAGSLPSCAPNAPCCASSVSACRPISSR